MYYSKNKDLVTIDGLNFAIFLTSRSIQNRISQLASQISKDYADKTPKFLVVLNGGLVLGADLIRHCDIPCTVSCVKIKSYRGMESTENIEISMLDESIIKDQDIIVVEDIVDTGQTMSVFLPKLEKMGAKSVKLFSLLHKPSMQTHEVQIDYTGFAISEKFVVGYGLDYNGRGRNLSHIYQLVDIIE